MEVELKAEDRLQTVEQSQLRDLRIFLFLIHCHSAVIEMVVAGTFGEACFMRVI